MLKEKIEHIKKLIVASKFNEAKELIDSTFTEKKYDTIKKDIIVVVGSFNRLSKNYEILNTINFEEYDRGLRKITHSFTNLLEELEIIAAKDTAKKRVLSESQAYATKNTFQTRPHTILLNSVWIENLAIIAKNICSIHTKWGGAGTGFVIKGNLVITASFVINKSDPIADTIVRFNYEENIAKNLKPTITAGLKETKYSDNQGISIIEIEENDFVNKLLPIEVAPKRPKVGEQVIVIQHPLGGPKKIDIYAKITKLSKEQIAYNAITSPGSSGSPVFDLDLKLVGIHWGKFDDNAKCFIPMDIIMEKLQKQSFTL